MEMYKDGLDVMRRRLFEVELDVLSVDVLRMCMHGFWD